ncbi:MAG: hypothetical protein GEV10_25185 [Streptosporangiales bacterium]|nr:hypothetical protein [Streptosporangiales bacterium]
MTTPTSFMSYDEIGKAFADHPVRLAEIPVEHHVSTPLPTLRWGRPAFAAFAAPARRVPRQPTELSTPDRWLLVDASHGRLVAYDMVAAVPFATDLPAGPVTAVPARTSVAAAREDLRMLGELMDQVAPAFLAGEDGDATTRRDLAEVLGAVLPAATVPWYRALTPDFFAWLEG